MPGWSATQLVNDIEKRIGNGQLCAGDRLSPVRAVAQELDISPNTVAAAYRRLRERGVVVGRGRQGTVVAARTIVAVAPVVSLPTDVVDAASGNPDEALMPVPSAQTLAAALAPGSRYGDAMVDPDLLAAGIDWLGQDDLNVDRLAVASGAMDAIERILVAHFSIGDRIGVEDPGHVPVHQIVASLGMIAVPMQIDEFGVTPAELETTLSLGVSAIVLTPRAQNPTGAAFDAERAADLGDVLAEYPDVLVVEDDHAGPISGVAVHYQDHERPHWVVVRSVAKSLGPDTRLAFLAGDNETLDRVEGRMQMGPGWVSHFLQRVVAATLQDPAAQTSITNAAATYKRRRELMIQLLADLGVSASGRSGFQVWVPCENSESVVSSLRNRGYAVRGADGYRLASPSAIRITVSALTDDQIEEIAVALGELLGNNPSAAQRTSLLM